MSAKARHAVLGLVIERPGYGYDLVQRLNERFGAYGWQSTGVYGALDKLSRDGHVVTDDVKGGASTARAAPRAIYRSTQDGRDFFREWQLKPSAPALTRQELDLKIAFANPEILPEMIEKSWAQEQQCIDELRALTGRAPSRRSLEPTWGEMADVLQRDGQIALLRVRVEWLQNARQMMKEMLKQTSGRVR